MAHYSKETACGGVRELWSLMGRVHREAWIIWGKILI
jgi:hypothetical protein